MRTGRRICCAVVAVSWSLCGLFAGTRAAADEIDFEGLPAGAIVSQLSKGMGVTGNMNGVIAVIGHNTRFPVRNAAIIFDSHCPASVCSYDVDLLTPHVDFGGEGLGAGGAATSPFANDTPLGNILILANTLEDDDGDGLVDRPDDADLLGFLNFDFSGVRKNRTNGTATVSSFTLMDVEVDQAEVPALVEFSGPSIPTSTIAVFDMGDNGVATVDGIGLSGVQNMRVYFKGSAALVSVIFDERSGRACWITTGGFQNAGVQAGGKDFTFGGNVGPPPSGSWQVIDHVTGDNFHSNDVHIVECVEISGTGPGQPGGKKGFVINQAFFAGIGRLNGEGGYPFEGYVIDRGEPSGKNGNDTDEFELVAYDPVTGAVVFNASGPLDGGNVQIHPPVGP